MKHVLIIVDMQNDFVEGGPLACPGGEALAPRISKLFKALQPDLTVTTQDWHPSSYSKHFDKWPKHCIAGTPGAEMVPGLVPVDNWLRFFKGQGTEDDGYSGFEGVNFNGTSLNYSLTNINVGTVHVCGIATDYCVRATALDARKNGYTTFVWADCCVPVSRSTGEQAIEEMLDTGIFIVRSK